MALRGYSTNVLVAAEMGRTFTVAQQSQCDGLIEEAEDLIDQITSRAWLSTSPVTDELHTVEGPVVYLTNKPVTAITSVKVRRMAIGSTDTTLTAGSTYELLDAANGVLSLGNAYREYLVKVTYTFTTPEAVPPLIRRAATMLVAHWMVPRLNTDSYGIKRYSVGQELTVEFKDDGSRGVPDEVMDILTRRKALVFA